MKCTFAILLLGFFAMPALACPNFAGHFKAEAHLKSFTVTQHGCSDLSIIGPSMHPDPTDPQPIPNEYVLDGQRHKVWAGYFEFSYWQDGNLIVEPWSALTGGELLYQRRIWRLKITGSKTEIFETFFDTTDGSEIASDVYIKTN